MLITKTIGIDMGHRVPNHKSKCRNIHGHRYKIEVGVNDKIITEKNDSSEGMVIDFGDLKQVMMDIIDKKYDHGFCMYEKDVYVPIFEKLQQGRDMDEFDKWSEFESNGHQKIIFVPFIPTAENLAKHWFNELKPILLNKNIKLAHVKVWETPNSTAIYTKEGLE